MSYYIFFLIFFVFWIALAFLFKKSLVKVSAPACFFLTFVLYFFGLFGRLDIGMYVFFGIVAAATVAAVVIGAKKKELKRFAEIVLQPTSILFFIAGICLGLVFTNMMSYHWDEMTHWALVVKNMVAYDNFGNLGDTTTMFNQYVPATGVFMYAFQFFGHTFHNGHLYAAFDVLVISMMMPITELFSDKLSKQAILSTLIFFLLPCLFKFTMYCELLVDGLLGLSFAYMYLVYVVDRNKVDWFTVLTLALGAFFITLIKSTGLVMVVFGLLFIILDALLRDPKKVLAFIKKKSNIIMTVLLVAMIVFAKVSWSRYIVVNNVRSGWNASEMNMENIWKYITQPNEFQIAVTNRFLRDFFVGKFYWEFNAYLQVPQLLMFAIVIATYIVTAKRMKNIKYGVVNIVYTISIILGFGLVTLLLYVFSFSYKEALTVASYPRYMSAMNIGVILVLAINVIETFVKPKETAQVACETKGKGICGIKKLAIAAASFCVIGATLTALLNAHIVNDVLPNKVAYATYEDWIKVCEKLDDEDSVYYVMHDYKENNTYVRRYLKVRFFCTPTRCSGFSEGGSYADGRDAEIFVTGNPFSLTFSREKFEEETAGYKYLFIDKVSDEFTEKYGELFKEKPQAKTLYMRTEEQGKTVFVKAEL